MNCRLNFNCYSALGPTNLASSCAGGSIGGSLSQFFFLKLVRSYLSYWLGGCTFPYSCLTTSGAEGKGKKQDLDLEIIAWCAVRSTARYVLV